MHRDRRLHAALFAVLLVAASATFGGVSLGQLTATESNSLQSEPASAITANDSTDGDGNWSQPRANVGRTGVTSDDGPQPYGNVSWSNGEMGYTHGPIVVGDHVVAAYAGYEYPGGHIEAYDESNGTLTWNRSDVGEPVGPPTSINGTVFFAGHENEWKPYSEFPEEYYEDRNGLFAIDAEAGTLEWHRNESLSAPVAGDGTLFVSERPRQLNFDAYGNVTAVDPATGERGWTSDVQGKPLAYADGRLIVGNETDNTLSAVDATDGSLLWQTPVDQEFILHGDVAATDDGVYVTQGHHDDVEESTEGLVKFDADTGTEQWRRNLSAYMTSSMTGDMIHAPAVANGTVYVVTSDEMYPPDTRHGTVHALDAATGSAQWHFHTKAQLGSAPAVANGTVYAVGNYRFNDSRAPPDYPAERPFHPSGETRVAYALDAGTGAEQWNLTVPTFTADLIPHGIAIEDERLYFVQHSPGMTIGSTISTIEATDERPPWYLHPAGDQDFHPIDYDPTAIVDVEPLADGERYAPNTSVELNGSESNEPNGNISTYEWDLDDDGTYEVTGETATVRTSSVPCGIVRVTLRVTDDDGEIDTETVALQTER